MDYGDKLPPRPWYIFTPPLWPIIPPPLTSVTALHADKATNRIATMEICLIIMTPSASVRSTRRVPGRC